MTIEISKDKEMLLLKVNGRLDSTTAPKLEEALGDLKEIKDLQLDFANLQYISSAGLRVLLTSSKVMKKQGNMVIRNVNDEVMNVFTITGFADILTMERDPEPDEPKK